MNVFTLKMSLLTALVLKEHAGPVKKKLLELGIVDFRELEGLSGDEVLRAGTDETLEQVGSILQQVESLFHQVHETLPLLTQEDIEADTEIDIKAAERLLDEIFRSLAALREKQKQVTGLLSRYRELHGYLKGNSPDFLDLHVGSFNEGQAERLSGRLIAHSAILVSPEKSPASIVLSLSRERQNVEPVLSSFGWNEEVSILPSEAGEMCLQELERRIGTVEEERRKLLDSITAVIVDRMEELDSLYRQGRVRQLLGYISGHFSSTRNTTIFSGWIPSDDTELFETALQKVTGGVCVIEYTDEKEVDRRKVPVALDDSRFLQPFEKLVTNYSTPQYGTVNPTIFVAVSYLTMFALMFADAGQGLVIFLLGLIGSRIKKGHSILNLMMYLGIASTVSGVLFGSYFGFPLFPPLWFDYHGAVFPHSGDVLYDVYSILGITLKFGIIVIFTGLIINWVNLIRRREWIHLVFEKNGIIGAFLFAMGIYLSYGFVNSGYTGFPSSNLVVVSIALAVAALFFRVPLEHFLARKRGGFLLDSFMEWIVIILEIFSGYLSNTLSFMRVAGLGIAHVSLMAAFGEIASLSPNTAGYVLILILGNILVIALEGLSAAIQSLRLNYYEFFTKFFLGDGTPYSPITLNTRSSGRRI